MVSVITQRGSRYPDFALAFDEAVISDPPFEAVIHTASPFHFSVTDTKKELLDPGKGTSTPAVPAVSDEFSRDWYYWYPESNQEERPYGQKGCDHLLLCRNLRPN